MIGSKSQIIVLLVGAILVGLGFLGSPLDILFIPGALLVSLVFGLALTEWKRKSFAGQAPRLSPPVSQAQGQSGIKSPLPASAPGLVPLEKELPRKESAFRLPKFVVSHKVPLSLIGVGLPLIVGGLIAAGLNPFVAIGYGLLIPGSVLFGVGTLILFLQLYRRPGGLRRFCMHCGYEMSTVDFACGRCLKQPPSGVDTKTCPNCSAVIPAVARFCRDCGAGQPGSSLDTPIQMEPSQPSPALT